MRQKLTFKMASVRFPFNQAGNFTPPLTLNNFFFSIWLILAESKTHFRSNVVFNNICTETNNLNGLSSATFLYFFLNKDALTEISTTFQSSIKQPTEVNMKYSNISRIILQAEEWNHRWPLESFLDIKKESGPENLFRLSWKQCRFTFPKKTKKREDTDRRE